VPPIVVEHVSERAPDLERRPEWAEVKTIGENATRPFEQAIESLSQPNAERLHAARELPRALRLDNDVQVIRLDGIMNDARIPGARQAKRLAHLTKRALFAQVR